MRLNRRFSGVLVGAVLDLALLTGQLRADAGDLDLAFGRGGTVTTDLSGADDEAKGVAVQRDGKIVVVGLAGEGTHADFALARYNMDGTLDLTFGAGGKVTTDFAGRGDGATAVAIQAN